MLFVTMQPVTVAKMVKKLSALSPIPDPLSAETNPLDQLLRKKEELENQITASDVKAILTEIQEEFAKEGHGVELVCVAQG